MTAKKPGFMERLKRHHIFRVASLYATAAWVLILVANQVFPNIGLTHMAIRILIVALALGFPVALALGWMLIAPTDVDPKRLSRWRRLRWRLGGAVSLVVILLVTASGVYLWRVNERLPGSALGGSDIPAKSIAVLPFENLSKDADNAYFASGMQEMILTKLAGIKDLKVISRTSTEKYASHPDNLKDMAEALGVATILEGSVQKAGDHVLINVQLIDATTDSHLWADAYTRSLDDVFGVEGEVAEDVADKLAANLSQGERAEVRAAPTENPAAYDLFLRAEYQAVRAYHDFSAAESEEAVQYYSGAVAADPGFALAWARRAGLQSLMAWSSTPYSGVDRVAAEAGAKEALARAEALAPGTPDTLIAKGGYALYVDTDLEAGVQAYRAAVAADPDNAEALYMLGVAYNHLGRFDDAAEAQRRAVIMDPRNPACLFELVRDVVYLRRYREGVSLLQRAIALDPESAIYPKFLALVSELMGDPDAGLQAIEAAPSNARGDPGLQLTKAELLYFKRDYDGARGVLRTITPGADRAVPWELETLAGDVERTEGNADAARAHYAKALSLIQGALKQPGGTTGRIRYELADIYAGLGRKTEALEEGRQAVSAEQDAKSLSRAYYAQGRLAQVAAKVADAGTSVTTLDTLLAAPAGFAASVEFIRRHPAFDPIRNDPAFQALLKKYQNSGGE